MLRLNNRTIVFDLFPNNETKMADFELSCFKEKNVLELKYNNDLDLIHLLFVKQRLDSLKQNCVLFIWYMPYSRMDRQMPGKVFTLKYICEYINSLNFERVIVMEPHSDVTNHLLEREKAVYPVKDFLPKIIKEIAFDTQKDHIVLPDKGSAERYENLNYPNICVLKKRRNPLTDKLEEMELVKGNINLGSKCIIIDDICAKGSTSIMAANILKKRGASFVYLLVSHCEDTVFKGTLLNDDSPINSVYTTDAILTLEHPKIHILDLDVMTYID